MKLLSFDIGTKNLSYCIIDITTKPGKIIEWDIINLYEDENSDIEKKTKKKLSFDEISKILIMKLHELFIFHNEDIYYNYVIIENQPAKMNMIMKSISIMIHTIFNTISCQNDQKSIVKFVAAGNKAKVLYKPENVEINTKSKYRERKLLSIAYTRHYLEEILNDDENLTRFLSCHKKDDLADSFLLGMHYIENHIK